MNIRANKCKVEQSVDFFFTDLEKKYSHLLSKTIHMPNNLYIAYSGGIDSTVLLYSVFNYIHKNCTDYADKIKIIPVHIHHGISQYADDWLNHSINFAEKLGLELVFHKVNIKQLSKELGIEAAARELRYEAINKTAQNNLVLLGQHAQDQLETFILQWQRGSGIDGLSGMPYFHYKQTTPYCRPFLNLDKKNITEYAKKHNLIWIEDDSNSDESYKRNGVRIKILPNFKQGELEPMLRSIKLLQIQKSILDQYLENDLTKMRYDKSLPVIYSGSTLLNNYFNQNIKINIENISENQNLIFPLSHQKLKSIFLNNYEHGLLLLRYWLKLNGLHIPSYKEVHSLIQQLGLEFEENLNTELKNLEICIKYDNNYITLYHDLLVIYKYIYLLDNDKNIKNNQNEQEQQYIFNLNNQNYNYNPKKYAIIAPSQSLKLSIPKRPTKTLKHIFQEQKISPWLRGFSVICDENGYVIYHPYLYI